MRLCPEQHSTHKVTTRSPRTHTLSEPAAARLTYGRMSGFVSFLVGAHSPAVEERVQGLLLSAPRQAAEALAARPGIDAARLALGEGAR